MKKQYEVLNWAFSFLKEHQCEENSANLLLQHLLNMNEHQLILNMRESVAKEIIDQFESMVKEHATLGVPIQHLIGYTYFYGRKFFVDDRVLIPRFDTESLVERALTNLKERYHQKNKLTIVDIGTGSGIIAITLALELPELTIYATDISDKALQVAEKNAKELNADVCFLKGDLLNPIIKEEINPDMIISNPPYIRESDRDTLEISVKSFDPSLALFGGDDGLKAYRRILMQSSSLPKNNKRIVLFEIGYDQAEDVTNLIQETFINAEVEVYQDLAGKDRVILF